MSLFRTPVDHGLTVDQTILLTRLGEFDLEWGGKVIRCLSEPGGRQYPEFESFYVIGHDGPIWKDGKWWFANTMMGWGCVQLMSSPGVTRHVDPALLLHVRLDETGFCPYQCKDGWLEGYMTGDTPHYEEYPEYECLCPVHKADDRARAEDLYHMGWDEQTEDERRELHAITNRGAERPVKTPF